MTMAVMTIRTRVMWVRSWSVPVRATIHFGAAVPRLWVSPRRKSWCSQRALEFIKVDPNSRQIVEVTAEAETHACSLEGLSVRVRQGVLVVAHCSPVPQCSPKPKIMTLHTTITFAPTELFWSLLLRSKFGTTCTQYLRVQPLGENSWLRLSEYAHGSAYARTWPCTNPPLLFLVAVTFHFTIDGSKGSASAVSSAAVSSSLKTTWPVPAVRTPFRGATASSTTFASDMIHLLSLLSFRVVTCRGVVQWKHSTTGTPTSLTPMAK